MFSTVGGHIPHIYNVLDFRLYYQLNCSLLYLVSIDIITLHCVCYFLFDKNMHNLTYTFFLDFPRVWVKIQGFSNIGIFFLLLGRIPYWEYGFCKKLQRCMPAISKSASNLKFCIFMKACLSGILIWLIKF